MGSRRSPASDFWGSTGWNRQPAKLLNLNVDNWSYRLSDRQSGNAGSHGVPKPLRGDDWERPERPVKKSNRPMIIGISLFVVVASAAIIAGFVVALRPSGDSSSSGVQLAAAALSSSSSSMRRLTTMSSTTSLGNAPSLIPVRTIANPGQIATSAGPPPSTSAAASSTASGSATSLPTRTAKAGVEGDIIGLTLEQCISNLTWNPYPYLKPFANVNPGDTIGDVEYCITDAAGPCGQGIYNGTVKNCSLTFESFCYYNRAMGQFLQSQLYTGKNPPAKYFNCGQEECGATAKC
ncbi:hypothetical protein M427DRAFT_31724 [Gonapodya prolifera JEL478]|uniref:Uncharacterized protein n=1 Tax=Gonapodya prolifera (strain JEL478) TaxID=1344416 RepID=A0A139AID3_GONPJ|nr:hypothetical protein M427DRAFT_31724 [Gonapodya prolifera JEL478]|eukprot:KXS16183.1 hypothetical protein M427DRAFT_31724 [Gonapodya prolifera JEL478]